MAFRLTTHFGHTVRDACALLADVSRIARRCPIGQGVRLHPAGKERRVLAERS